METCYFYMLCGLAFMPCLYAVFRISVGNWLQSRRAGKRKVKKLMKGKKNYWWYERIHTLYGLGMLYPMNKLITILYPVMLAVGLCFGWSRAVAPIVCGLHILLALLLAVTTFFCMMQENREKYGIAIVLLRWDKGHFRVDSLFFDLTISAFPILIAYEHLKSLLQVLQST